MKRFLAILSGAGLVAVSLFATPLAASAQNGEELGAYYGRIRFAELPDTAASNTAGAVLGGTRQWLPIIGNGSQSTVTSPTVTVNSGYDPSLFDWGGPVSAFPATMTGPSLAPGDSWMPEGLTSSIPVEFSAGFDSTRTVDTATIPAGGGQQTVTITVTPVDPRYGNGSGGYATAGVFHIMVFSFLPGVTVASATDPANLDQGENLEIYPAEGEGDLYHWMLVAPQLNKQYTFSLVLNVPNPNGAPFEFRPAVRVDGSSSQFEGDGTGPSVTVADPTLDGSAPGSGGMTFSVAETSHTWTIERVEGFFIQYADTTPQVSETSVTIEVKPGSLPPAPIHVDTYGSIPVAILSTDTFDATTVDPGTVRFGPQGTEAPPVKSAVTDVNGDGVADMILHFSVGNVGISCGDTSVSLTGQTTDGQSFSGSDAIRTVGC